jgi:hypothetical protein
VGDALAEDAAEAAGAVVVPVDPADADAEVPVVPAEPDDPPGVHAASAAAAVPAPKNMPRDRRLINVERSNWRPRSWSGCGECRSSGVRGDVLMDP